MSKLAAAAAVSLLALTAPYAHADIVEPTQEPAPGAPAAPPPPPHPSFENWTADGEVPPLNGGRLLAEAGLGTAFALGGGLGGAFIGMSLEVSNGCHNEMCGLGGLVIGGAAGLMFATPVGVYLAGSAGDETGSLGATVGGSVIGSLAGAGLAAGIGGDAIVPLLVAGPVIGSMVGFNLTRDYSASHKRRSHVVVPVASAGGERTTFGLAGSF